MMEADYMCDLRLRVNDFLFSRATKGNLGWLAGVVDGDGNFHIGVEWKHSDVVASFNPYIKITNTVPPLFRKMHSMGLRAKVTPRGREKKNAVGHTKQSYDAKLYAKDLRLVLPKIVDELATKRPQGEAMLKVLELLKTAKSDERDDAILKIREEIMALNQREWPLETWS